MAQMSQRNDDAGTGDDGEESLTDPSDDACFGEAAEWHARWRLAGTALSTSQVDEWVRWIAIPQNRHAYDAVELVANARYALEPPSLPTAEELAADVSDDEQFDAPLPDERVVELRRGVSPIALSSRGANPPMRRSAPRFSPHWLRASGFALAAIAVAFTFTPAMQWLNPQGQTEPAHLVSTTAGEVKHITLRDGSKVTLGAKTELSVRFDHCARTFLLTRGEALFSVAHDANCPFIVVAGGGAITALGTEFSVRRTLDRVTVQVAEGSVSVQPRDTLTLASVQWPKTPDAPNVAWSDAKLEQGQEVTYAGADDRSAVASEDPNVATAWLDGRRVYRREPLTYLVADIGRYFDESIEVDADVGDLQFTGLVYQSQVKKFLQDLEIIFPVKVSRTADNRIVIHARGAAEAGSSDPTSDSKE
jgi:transmembrane sensor